MPNIRPGGVPKQNSGRLSAFLIKIDNCFNVLLEPTGIRYPSIIAPNSRHGIATKFPKIFTPLKIIYYSFMTTK